VQTIVLERTERQREKRSKTAKTLCKTLSPVRQRYYHTPSFCQYTLFIVAFHSYNY